MKVCLTVDMEHDCPPYLTGYRGIEEGTPHLMGLFAREEVAATFFTTGDVSRRYPQIIQMARKEGQRLIETAQAEITRSTASLRQHYPVVSFRAPNLRFPNRYLPLLEEAGYRLDSSQALYKTRPRHTGPSTHLTRIPASVTSSVLRLPRWLRNSYLTRLKNPAVLFVHPWEFVDLRKERLRIDCRFRTGKMALECLQDCIQFFRREGADFVRMQDLLTQDTVS